MYYIFGSVPGIELRSLDLLLIFSSCYLYLSIATDPTLHSPTQTDLPIAHLRKTASTSSTIMATNMRYVELAKQLHPRLQRFFAKYPPNQILPTSTRLNTIKDGATPNPFLPHKHPVTGKWHDPEFSLRRQAELVKLARENGVEELLPFTSKGTEERIRHRVEFGLRVRGTGVGQRVKGHLHERMLAPKYVAVIAIAAPDVALEPWVWVLGRMLMLAIGWRREEQLCWVCPDLYGNGERYVVDIGKITPCRVPPY